MNPETSAPSSAPIRSPRGGKQTEDDLVIELARRLTVGWPIRSLGLEVRAHGRSRIDLCVELRAPRGRTGNRMLVGIEAKLLDGPGAVRQASLNRYSVDLSFICMPSQRVSQRLLQLAKRNHLGVLSLDAAGLSIAATPTILNPDPSLAAQVRGQLNPVRGRGSTGIRDLFIGGDDDR